MSRWTRAGSFGHSAWMRFELSGQGCGALQLGLDRTTAHAVISTWGECRSFRRGGQGPESLFVQRSAAAVFAYFDDMDCVDAVEIATPGHGIESDDQVTFEGLDVFFHPADDVIRHLSEHGHRLVHSEGGLSTDAPDVLLALWRDQGPEGEDGLPVYFEAALVARPGYHD